MNKVELFEKDLANNIADENISNAVLFAYKEQMKLGNDLLDFGFVMNSIEIPLAYNYMVRGGVKEFTISSPQFLLTMLNDWTRLGCTICSDLIEINVTRATRAIKMRVIKLKIN